MFDESAGKGSTPTAAPQENPIAERPASNRLTPEQLRAANKVLAHMQSRSQRRHTGTGRK